MAGLGVDLDELGIKTARHENAAAEPDTAPIEHEVRGGALIPGEPLAQVLYQVWSGREVCVVPSPPGAGKSTLLVRLIAHLVPASGMTVQVITPTRRSAIDIAERLAAELGRTKNGDPYVYLGMTLKTDEDVSLDVATSKNGSSARQVVVSTVASASMRPREVDLMVVDEAYQSVFSEVAHAAELAKQIVLVGDPGQIGPIVVANTSMWEGGERAPHRPAPEVFALDGDAFTVSLPSTYRVGARTVEAIAPLYDFPFDSKRPERYIVDADGRVPEISAVEVPFAGEFDLDALAVVAQKAIAMIGRDYVEHRPDGQLVSRKVTGADIAVGVARSAQHAALVAMFEDAGGEAKKITVGTADRLQGGQWPVFVGLDPLAGAEQANDFRTAPGRLCVLLSRHEAHLTWVHDGRWAELLTSAANVAEAARGLAVREKLVD